MKGFCFCDFKPQSSSYIRFSPCDVYCTCMLHPDLLRGARRRRARGGLEQLLRTTARRGQLPSTRGTATVHGGDSPPGPHAGPGDGSSARRDSSRVSAWWEQLQGPACIRRCIRLFLWFPALRDPERLGSLDTLEGPIPRPLRVIPDSQK